MEGGDEHTLEKWIRDKRAYVWCFGKNSNGELGVQSTKDVLDPKPVHNGPTLFREAGSARGISSGGHHTALVTKSGHLYMCGSTLHGKLGIQGLNMMQVTRFHPLPMAVAVKQVACGDYHSMCLTEDGQVYSWGGSLYKKLANVSANSEPSLVNGLSRIVAIDCGDFHSLALDDEGRLFTWGGGGASYNKG